MTFNNSGNNIFFFSKTKTIPGTITHKIYNIIFIITGSFISEISSIKLTPIPTNCNTNISIYVV